MTTATMRWQTSLTFRRFRKKLTDISRIHWSHTLGADSINQILDSEDDSTIYSNVINTTFDSHKDSHTVKDIKEWIPNYMDRTRLFLLIICSANLEAYLKEITEIYLLSKGYFSRDNLSKADLLSLNKVGKALGAPILNKSSIPEPLKYAECLFDVSFGEYKTKWTTLYKLRCVAAHNGGMAMIRTMTEIPSLSASEFDLFGISWTELKEAMDAADQIASIIDKKISNYDVLMIEAEQTIRWLALKGNLPTQNNVWPYLYDNFGLYRFKGHGKKKLLNIFYTT